MSDEKLNNLIKTALIALAAAFSVWIAVKYLVRWTLPVLLAMCLASAAEPAITRISDRFSVRRGAVSFTVCLVLVGAMGGLIFMCAGRAVRELSGFIAELPELLSSVGGKLTVLREKLYKLTVAAPPDVRKYITSSVSSLGDRLGTVPAELTSHLLKLTAAFCSDIPAAALAAVTFVLSLFFISAQYGEITSGIKKLIPENIRCVVCGIKRDLFSSVGTWLRTQFIIALVTFAELTASFLIMRIRYPVLIASATAFVDMLPVLGSGTVLLPWAAILLISGETSRAFGLFAVYLVVTFVHSALEPKLLGGRTGLSPAASIASVYAGFKAAGVGGMIVSPILLLTAKQIISRCSKQAENEKE